MKKKQRKNCENRQCKGVSGNAANLACHGKMQKLEFCENFVT